MQFFLVSFSTYRHTPATLARRPCQWTSFQRLLHSPFLFSYACVCMSAKEKRERESMNRQKNARESDDPGEAIARKVRVFHRFLLVFGWDITRPKSRRRRRERHPGQPNREYPSVFCIILILCATPREETLGIKRLNDDVANSTVFCAFENKSEYIYIPISISFSRSFETVMLHGNSSGIPKGNGCMHWNFTAWRCWQFQL